MRDADEKFKDLLAGGAESDLCTDRVVVDDRSEDDMAEDSEVSPNKDTDRVPGKSKNAESGGIIKLRDADSDDVPLK